MCPGLIAIVPGHGLTDDLLPRLYAILDAFLPDERGTWLHTPKHWPRLVHSAAIPEQNGNPRVHVGAGEGTEEAYLASRLRVRFIMNDRADLCLAAEFRGVHVGQDDLSPESVREIIGPERWLGVSTHNPEQLSEADLTSADYLAIGPVFTTSSKEKPDPVVGLEGVRRAPRLDTQASGCDRGHHSKERRFCHRSRGRLGGGDIRSVTGSGQISRRIFPNIRGKVG